MRKNDSLDFVSFCMFLLNLASLLLFGVNLFAILSVFSWFLGVWLLVAVQSVARKSSL